MRRSVLNCKNYILTLTLFLIIPALMVNGATRTASVSGNWSSTTTWGGSAAPVAGDAVIINSGVTVTIDVTAACASITINAAAATNGITFSGTNTLTVSGAITMNAATAAVISMIDVDEGTLNAASISIAGSTTSGRITRLAVSSGTIDCSGNISFSGTAAQAQLTFSGSGTLNIAGNLGTGGTFTASTGTVNYDRAGTQTIGLYTYNNLTLSGTSAKTFPTGTTVVNGIISMEGTATATVTGTLTYGASATLQYNTPTARTVGSEWKTPFASTGGVIIANTGAITLNGNKVFNANCPLTINSGATLTPGTRTLTLNGNFINNGTYTTGSGAITITGTATQSVGRLATTSSISVTKTSGTVTFTDNINAGSFSMSTSTNGTTAIQLSTGIIVAVTGTLTIGRPASGTNNFLVNDAVLNCAAIALGGSTAGSRFSYLSLSSGTITVTGNITTAGAASGIIFSDNGTINVGGTFMTAATLGTLTPSTGTVNYNSAGAQTISLLTYNNLTLSNAGTKTFPAGTTTVNGIHSIEGTATATVTGTLVYGASASLQYKTTNNRTTGSEWPATCSGTGGVKIFNTSGTITLGAAKTISAASSITIGDGTTPSILDDGGHQITCTGTLNLNSGTFKLGGTNATTFPGFSSINIAAGTTVEYDATASQTVSTIPTYSNLTLTGSTKTIGTEAAQTLDVANSLVINASTIYLGSTYNPQLNVGGDFTNSGTFSQGSGTVTFNGDETQNLSGNLTFKDLTIANNESEIISNDDLTVSLNSDMTINNNAIFTFQGTTLSIGGDFINNGSFNAGTGTTVFNGGAGQGIGGNNQTIFNNLTLDNADGLSIEGTASQLINGTLLFTDGKITTGPSSIILGNSATVSGAGAGKYIFGNLTKGIASSTSSKNFEIGDESNYTRVTISFSGTATNGTGSITASVGSGDHPQISTSTIDPLLSVNRYWRLTNNGVTFGSYNVTFTFINPGDLDPEANTSLFIINRYASSTWSSPTVGTLTTTTSQATGLNSSSFGDFQVGELKVPRITIGTISDFGFQHVNTISAEQNYSVTGRNLTAPIMVTPPAGFEVSTSSGSGFISYPASLTLTPVGGNVSATVYVRFHPLLIQDYSGNITHTSTGATQRNLAVSGTSELNYCSSASVSYYEYESITNVTFAGINNSSPVSKTTGYTDYTGSIAPASVVQGNQYPINVSEAFLSTLDNGYVKVFIDYNQNGVFEVPSEVAYGGAYTANMTFIGKVRIPLSAMTGTTRMRVIAKGNGTNADTDPCGTYTWGETEDYLVTIGSLITPALIADPDALPFGYVASAGTSSEKTYTLTGVNLTPSSGNITINAPSNFEISLTSGSGFTSSLTLPYNSGSLPSTTIYCRFRPTASNTNYSSAIANLGGGAASVTVSVIGTSWTYCTSSGSTSTDKSIVLVNLNTLNNSTGKTAAYNDYTATHSTDLIKDESYLLTVGVNTDGSYRVHGFAWIDWNQDGDFVDSGEAYDLGSVYNQEDGLPDLCPVNITVPSGAVSGMTRMRVSARYNTDPTPCATGYDGEVEDYALNIVAPLPKKYRTVNTGNWSTISIWESSSNNGVSWDPATAAPSSTDGTITIRNTHTVTLTASVTADELTIESTGSLVLNQDIEIADGDDPDLDVYGTLDCSNSLVTGAGTITIQSGANLFMKSTGGISASGNTGNIRTTGRSFSTEANYKYNGTSAQITGDGLPLTVNNLTIDNSSGVSLTNNVTLNGSLTLTSGAFSVGAHTLTFQNSNTPVVRTSGTLTTGTSSNLVFGTPGNTGGNAFSIPSNTFTGSPVINNLMINRTNSLTLNNQVLSVQGIVLCNGPLATNNNLLLASTSSQTALIDGSGTGSITGNVTMERYLASGFGYKYVSSPFTAATVNELAEDIDLTASFPTFYRYEQNLNITGWINYTSTSGTLTPLAGYAGNFGDVLAPKTFDITGVVNNGAIGPVTLYNHNKTYTLGFNLVGNPYPSPINWNASSGWTKTNIDNALYYFNNGTSDQYTGTYSTYINGVSSDGIASNIIPAMQGFFIHVSNGTYPVTAQFGMNNNVRVNNLNPVYHKDQLVNNKPLIRFSAAFEDSKNLTDPLVIYMDENATLDFDNEKDALKLINTDIRYPNIYSFSSERNELSINAIPDQIDSLTIIPVGFTTFSDGLIRIIVDKIENLPSSLNVYLYDDQTKKYNNLLTTSEYLFNQHSGTSGDRFSIVFSTHPLKFGSVNPGEFNAYAAGSKIVVFACPGQGETGTINIYNMIGQRMFQERIYENKVYEFDPGLDPGIYIVEFISSSGQQSKKVLISEP